MAEPKPSPILAIVLVVLVIVAGGGAAAFLYFQNHKTPAPSPLTVQVGDNATVDYIGLFGSSPQQGRVFDTSEFTIALNNASWPKSLEYLSRGGHASDYSPLPVHVGPTAPGNGYTLGNATFGTVVPGFWQGLLGLQGNRTHYITVPTSLGYPLVNSSCILTAPLTTTYPVLVSLSPSRFATLFPNASATAGTSFTDPAYGWSDRVLSTNLSAVTYENLPTLGMTTDPNGLPVVVSNISATTITLHSRLNPNQAGLVTGHTATPVCSSSSFIVTQINLGSGTYVEDYNREVYGQTLIFVVSVVDIFPA